MSYDEVTTYRQECATLRAKLEQATKERNGLRCEVGDYGKEIANLRLRIKAVDAEHMDMERQKHRSVEAFQKLEKQLTDAQAAIARLEDENAALTQRVTELEGYLAAASQRHANIFAEYYARAEHEPLLEEVQNLKQLLLTERQARL